MTSSSGPLGEISSTSRTNQGSSTAASRLPLRLKQLWASAARAASFPCPMQASRAVTVVPMVSAVLCIAVAFLGEFERGAYSFLFTFSQIGLAVLMISQIAIIALWTMDSGRFSWRIAAPLLADGLFLAGLLIAGMGRANEDNTYYVTLRQCAAMIQLILCGWLLCYPLYPRTSESEMD